MDNMSIEQIEEIRELVDALTTITGILSSALDTEAVLKNEVFNKMAEHDVSERLPMDGKLLSLKKKGCDELVADYIIAQKDVVKLKHRAKQAEHALNARKHINNTLPR